MSKINKRAVLIKSVQVRFFFKESINIHARLFGTQSSQQQQQKDVSRTCDSRGQKLYFLNDTLCYHWGNFVPLIEKSFIHSNLQNHFTKTVLLPWKSSSIVIRFMRGWRNVLLWSHDWHGCMSYLSHGLMTMMMDKRRMSHVIWMAPYGMKNKRKVLQMYTYYIVNTGYGLDSFLQSKNPYTIKAYTTIENAKSPWLGWRIPWTKYIGYSP